MHASKESAEIAKNRLTSLSDSLSQGDRDRLANKILYIREFLDAVTRRLPTTAAIERDRKRTRRTKRKQPDGGRS